MKKMMLFVPLVLILGCAQTGIVVKEFRPDHVVHVSAIQKLDAAADLDDYVWYLDKGDTFPLELDLDSGILGVTEKKVTMVVKERVCFRVKMPQGLSREQRSELENLSREQLSAMSDAEKENFYKDFMMYVSRDCVRWAPYNDLQALKDILGIRGGSLSLGMGMTRKDGVWSTLDLVLRRQ